VYQIIRLSAATLVFLNNVGFPLALTDSDQDTELQRTYLASVMDVTVCSSPFSRPITQCTLRELHRYASSSLSRIQNFLRNNTLADGFRFYSDITLGGRLDGIHGDKTWVRKQGGLEENEREGKNR
jgi:hypothetical protein